MSIQMMTSTDAPTIRVALDQRIGKSAIHPLSLSFSRWAAKDNLFSHRKKAGFGLSDSLMWANVQRTNTKPANPSWAFLRSLRLVGREPRAILRGKDSRARWSAPLEEERRLKSRYPLDLSVHFRLRSGTSRYFGFGPRRKHHQRRRLGS
jgi:hypothetical protein